ncbi:TIM barrel protein [Intrasporangium calvum]|uniref:TIM barrel protein n=1 Tax=Intrasporangium calvum TaxID=53358 RepID=UPI000DF64262|nr:TIM barrel protein [Intrasporangium calvum]AXG15114.1 inosose dehydratase [Intrasporangium calvum]
MTGQQQDEPSRVVHPHHLGARPLAERIASAPISWGVSEVPGWGWQFDPHTVLAQMAEIGLAATELGPDGFLPDAPADRVRLLGAAGLEAAGQLVSVVLHDATVDPLAALEPTMDALVATEATTLVVVAATGVAEDATRPDLDEAAWATLLRNLDRLEDAARSRGLVAAVHASADTVVQSLAELQRVIDGSRIGVCLDTGHLALVGDDPLSLALARPGRIVHVHLKDVRAAVAERVRSGELSLVEAVRAGLHPPLGQGDLDIAAIVSALEDAGYDGWYVLEQDVVLDEDPGAPGPARQVEQSLDHLLGLAAQWSGVGA